MNLELSSPSPEFTRRTLRPLLPHTTPRYFVLSVPFKPTNTAAAWTNTDYSYFRVLRIRISRIRISVFSNDTSPHHIKHPPHLRQAAPHNTDSYFLILRFRIIRISEAGAASKSAPPGVHNFSLEHRSPFGSFDVRRDPDRLPLSTLFTVSLLSPVPPNNEPTPIHTPRRTFHRMNGSHGTYLDHPPLRLPTDIHPS